ncbi:MAG: type I pullulanase [Flavobacteriales bacterium]
MNKRNSVKLLAIGFMFIACNPKQENTVKNQKGVQVNDQTNLAFNPYQDYPIYEGNDLGVQYTKEKTVLRLWSPEAEQVKLKLYKTSLGNDLIEEINCVKKDKGVWVAELKGDHKDRYYAFQAKFQGNWNEENVDPYAKAVGVNGKRGQIIDFADTNPEGWENDKSPELKNATDAIIYELHVRDLSISPDSGIQNKGKYLGFTEEGTQNKKGVITGIDHIKDMGVTHVHILPAFDHRSIDETKLDSAQFNWGYDPQNYNVPEGSYSTDPEDGKVRIKEFKQMVQSMHKKGLRVVMDVVYNHTGYTHDSNFDQLVPGYYYRQWEKDQKYSDAAACGNETASDRAMVRKFIVESVVYWAKEYHIDGFRFDLMAIHDMETMNQVAAALKKVDPTILIYGEGWTAGDSPLPEKYRALKMHANQMKDIAVFSDDIRDAVKGNVFDEKSTGFISGNKEMKEAVKIGIVGAGEHPQVDYEKGYYAKQPYANNPTDVVNYVSCHDNHTLYDKLKVSREDVSEEDLIKMHKLANTIVMTSQGIPFLHAGVEMKRTKGGEHNSYKSPDSVNQIVWDLKSENKDLVKYYKELIALRKNHPAFRMTTNEMIQNKLEFIKIEDEELIVYQLKDHANKDEWKNIMLIFNGSDKEKDISLPNGSWMSALSNYTFEINLQKEFTKKIQVPSYSATILYQK